MTHFDLVLGTGAIFAGLVELLFELVELLEGIVVHFGHHSKDKVPHVAQISVRLLKINLDKALALSESKTRFSEHLPRLTH